MLTDEQFAALQQQHGRLIRVQSPAGELAFRRPTVAEENSFQAQLFSEHVNAGMARRNQMVTLVVYPSKELFAKALEEWPALNMNRRVIDALRVLRGEVSEDEVK